MISLEMRRTVHLLAQKNHGTRAIARTLNLPRSTVSASSRDDGCDACLNRPTWLDEHTERIGALIRSCRGNIVRVAEELAKIVEKPVGYSTLTSLPRSGSDAAAEQERAGG